MGAFGAVRRKQAGAQECIAAPNQPLRSALGVPGRSSEEKSKALRVEFMNVFKQRFTGAQANDQTSAEEQLLNILRGQLDEKDVTVLQETLPRNLRPLPGEK